MYFDPNEEGITHINIYSKAQSPLGRYLSNFYRMPIKISLGSFMSVEGLIYYLGSFDESLRTLSGATAKATGKILDRNIRLPEDIFKKFIIEAMFYKVETCNELKSLLINCDLPLTHYYTFGNKKLEVKGWDWQIEQWNKIRKNLKDTYGRQVTNP